MTPALAQVAATGTTMTADAPSLLGPDRILGMVGSLLVVLAVVLLLAWLAQRLGAVRNGIGRSIRVREVLSVGARDRLLLLDCEGERLLIGASPAGLVRLHAFGSVPMGEGEAVATGATTASPDAGSFARLVGRCLGRSPDRGAVATERGVGAP